MKRLRIAFTGHRPNKLNNEYSGGELTNRIACRVLDGFYRLYKQGFSIHVISGMALGIDMMAAEIAIQEALTWTAAIPFKGQELRWPKQSQEKYHKLLKEATLIEYVSTTEYNPHKMQVRNEWMVNNCDLLIGVWDGTNGGTANCIQYASRIEKPRIIIHPQDPNNVMFFDTKKLFNKQVA